MECRIGLVRLCLAARMMRRNLGVSSPHVDTDVRDKQQPATKRRPNTEQPHAILELHHLGGGAYRN